MILVSFALNLHSTYAHLGVPFSLGVSQNKRNGAFQSNEFRFTLCNTNEFIYIITKNNLFTLF